MAMSRAGRRVVVTGMGAITPLGGSLRATWSNLIASRSGVKEITDPDILKCKIASKVAACVPDTIKEPMLKAKRSASAPLFIQYALAASGEALADAGLLGDDGAMDGVDPERAGVAVGSGIGNIDEIVKTTRVLDARGVRRVSPYFVPQVLVNMASGHVSMEHGLRGPNHSVSTACATGANAIGDAARFIRHGDADVMLAGGTEACVGPISMAGFSQMRALSTASHADPGEASRPFDRDRDGFVIGEGCGVLVLEDADHATARGAQVYAEVVGYGLSGDAYHVSAPSPDGRGAMACMRAALGDAGLDICDIDYVNCHATSTPLGDAIEARAVRGVFGERAVRGQGLVVSSTKGALGHMLGAAGAVEAICTILAVSEGVAPPTLNLHALEDGFEELDFAPLEARKLVSPRAALSNSFGFGGVNASLAFGAWEGAQGIDRRDE